MINVRACLHLYRHRYDAGNKRTKLNTQPDVSPPPTATKERKSGHTHRTSSATHNRRMGLAWTPRRAARASAPGSGQLRPPAAAEVCISLQEDMRAEGLHTPKYHILQSGCVSGHESGRVSRRVPGPVSGVYQGVSGHISGHVSGCVSGRVSGRVTGRVSGRVSGRISGCVS
jgi:hypothetical protein